MSRLSPNTDWTISIHTLREEGDHIHGQYHSTASLISIHTLREEGDLSRYS